VGSCPTIETERLILRPFREGDLDAYTAQLQTPEVRAALHLPDDVGREQAWLGMATMLGQWELRGTGQWAAVEKSSGAFVGRVGSHWPERADWPGIEIGWSLHPEHWGKGYATEGGRATIDYVFAHHAVNEVWSLILEDNTRSQAVARRLGFELFDTRITSHFPSAAHGFWRLARPATTAS
jgi:RimJ/RimL family protein N-acetyltransferase